MLHLDTAPPSRRTCVAITRLHRAALRRHYTSTPAPPSRRFCTSTPRRTCAATTTSTRRRPCAAI